MAEEREPKCILDVYPQIENEKTKEMVVRFRIEWNSFENKPIAHKISHLEALLAHFQERSRTVRGDPMSLFKLWPSLFQQMEQELQKLKASIPSEKS